ncbi:CTD kinase subunit gamma [Zalerion maritima]|uniref:CTD kinase subunit gamma n=1 Tax=Zalerion maritima TaxID=339359 RepID=A0AAD5RJT6_9PEZI|nr:CTD kinase subunit gamma [Zalerion maritima]
MATLDPFEVRVRFSGMLQHMNASQNSAQKAAQFALKYANLSDDLHSCVLEQLEKGNMNVQANILHFIEHFMDQARKEGNESYVALMQKDICRIVDIVTPPTGEGYMNVKTVRKILHALETKKFLSPMLVRMLDTQLQSQESTNQQRLDDELPDAPPLPPSQVATSIPTDKERHKRLVEQRVEEDRERHKRQREMIWQKGFEEEKHGLWDDTSEFGEDDEVLGKEEEGRWKGGWGEECLHEAEEGDGRDRMVEVPGEEGTVEEEEEEEAEAEEIEDMEGRMVVDGEGFRKVDDMWDVARWPSGEEEWEKEDDDR